MASLTWFILLLTGLTYTHGLGTQTTIQNVPSIAQVEFRLGSGWRQQCMGSIISNFYIVSTGSCFSTPPGVRRIRVGSDTSGTGGTVSEVAIINNHPVGDLSVVRMVSPFWFSPTIQNVAIVPQGFLIPAHVELSLVGFGITAQGGLVASENLYSVELESKPITICMSQFPGRITPEHLCVGRVDTLGLDFDPSDAGAPISYAGFLAGVASFGSSYAYDLLPTVATAIGPYTNWIVQTAV